MFRVARTNAWSPREAGAPHKISDRRITYVVGMEHLHANIGVIVGCDSVRRRWLRDVLRSRLHGTRSIMREAHEYRQYAAECLESARTATTEEIRKHFLELARMWMTAAQQLDDGMSIPPSPEGRGETSAY